MTDCVIDASVVLRWALPDEQDREGALRVAEALAERELDAVGPPNFLLEVAAALVAAVRVNRIDEPPARAILGALSRVAIPERDAHGFAVAAYELALDAGMRVPDAAYILAAEAGSAALISADQVQLGAAKTRGVVAIDVREVPHRLP
jgi:predicted nucleic acid-binding protein